MLNDDDHLYYTFIIHRLEAARCYIFCVAIKSLNENKLNKGRKGTGINIQCWILGLHFAQLAFLIFDLFELK